jgi:hypothetical protein
LQNSKTGKVSTHLIHFKFSNNFFIIHLPVINTSYAKVRTPGKHTLSRDLQEPDHEPNFLAWIAGQLFYQNFYGERGRQTGNVLYSLEQHFI